jgi:hypothetical protein
MAITCGVSPFIIFGSIFKNDPLRDTGVLLILKALCFSIGYNLFVLITKPIIKQSLMSSDDIMRFGMPTILQIRRLYMMIFSSRLPIYMRMAFIPGDHHHQVNSTFNRQRSPQFWRLLQG